MCYNASSSITNYAYVTLVSIIVYLYGDAYDKHVASILTYTIQIQLVEFFMHLDQKCGWLNKIATIGAYFLIVTQPIFVYYFGNMFNVINMPGIFHYVYITYGIFGLIQWIYYIMSENNICSKKQGGHLVWGFEPNNSTIGNINVFAYLILLLLPLLNIIDVNIRTLFVIILFGSCVIHYILYPKHWKSMWCFFVSGMITIYAIVRYFALFN